MVFQQSMQELSVQQSMQELQGVEQVLQVAQQAHREVFVVHRKAVVNVGTVHRHDSTNSEGNKADELRRTMEAYLGCEKNARPGVTKKAEMLAIGGLPPNHEF